MGRNARLAKTSLRIASVLYIALGIFGFIFSMTTPIQVTINDDATEGRLWELTSEPAHFILLLIMILIPFVFGLIGLFLSRNIASNPTMAKAILLIVTGFISAFFLIGFVFIFAGIQTLLAKKERDVLASREEL